ncbi:MAG: methyltransferase [Saprospiraceae bacterium]|nr:methyltransferase [Saprospiraceae bacterium]
MFDLSNKNKSTKQPIYWKIYKFYFSKKRWYSFKSIKIKVEPTVFHPALFFTTKILLRYTFQLNIQGKKILELGAGSGMISAISSKNGAEVTSTDINPAAISSMRESRAVNNLSFEIIQSDLFQKIPLQIFDYILLNPPYFKGAPRTDRDKAFYCGDNFEYFYNLFEQIQKYITHRTEVYMLLSDDCNIQKIQNISNTKIFYWESVHQELVWGELYIIFKIQLI